MTIYFRNQELDPSISIAIIFIVPIVFVVNILFAIISFAFKKYSWISIFIFNAFIASLIAYNTFGNEMSRQQNMRLESWKFKINDTIFGLTRWKKSSDFSMSYSVSSGSSSGFIEGKYEIKNGIIFLTTDSLQKMKIEENVLYGFRDLAPIKMVKDER